ncbi:hypothetical protein CDD82_3935 [Ophiocordyceps australis]|uniref:Extragenic suppressor of kinetochore protein 1 n=1 Tax=Ophiocordyceps australis TaxID=1399860 RepID=A0A2C5ZT76_9HYPO|nr:hypothetical protein CDD82_3935 [Ophiocordyceps australis]
MFWKYGGYANISTIDTILDKPDFTLEELLNEADLIQELKHGNAKLIEYLRQDHVLRKLLDYVVAPQLEPVETPHDSPDDDSKGRSRLLIFSRSRASSRATENDDNEEEKRRNRYALIACEILSSETWSIYETLSENRDMIRDFWSFLSRPAPLDPLQASYFTKVNESLFEKKTDDMLLLFRSLPNIVPDLLKHVECPMIMDLLLKIIALDRTEGGQGIVEWLYSKDMIPLLLSCIDPKNSWVVQAAAGDFIKAIITISANASQNEQQCIGPNELTRQLVSRPCAEQLIGYMLGGGNPLNVGVGIVIEVIRKNNSDYDPDVGSTANALPSSRDPIYLGTLLRLFADNVPNFMTLIMNGQSQKQGMASTFGERLEPLGFDRFKTCELMAELLHCSNMGLLNEPGAEQLIAARDTERHRLRQQGQLGPHREDDPSVEDLTMRMPRAVSEEARRLEVANADDDGFEKVEAGRNQSQHVPHEPAHDSNDAAPPPRAISLGSFKEDLVDEPLDSPRDGQDATVANEQQFDHPELVVAPLSPNKIQPVELAPRQAHTIQSSGGQDAAQIPETLAATNKEPSLATEQEPTHTSSDALDSPVKVKTPQSPTASEPQSLGLSPHPDDRPAPLFASLGGCGCESPLPSPSVAATEEAQQPCADQTVCNDSTTWQEERSVSQAEHTELMEPVVGDYLKMQFVRHHVVPAILSFFFAYPWNNFLHNVVYDVVQQVFNGPMDRGYNPTLAVSLFESADVTTAIIKGQHTSDVSQVKTKTRMGYMGHLTLIAEEVVKFTERHPPELLSEMVLDKVMSQDWINYVEGALAETRERDNAILGGVRPDVAMGHRASIGGNGLSGVGLPSLGGASAMTSNALAEAGLNGGIELNEVGGNSIGPFTISAGASGSGFGSSSDEDEDEGEDDDINSEFRAYTDPLNTPSNSMAPPSIPPPPPPPLSIPPSRARPPNPDGENDEDEDISNPFRDGEDDLYDNGAEYDVRQNDQGSWWKGFVAGQDKSEDDDSDDEFGEFHSPEDREERDDADDDDDENLTSVVLRPLVVESTRETTRGLSGLWPFGTSKSEKDRKKQNTDVEEEMSASSLPAASESAVKVTEARSRTSIEDPDEEEVIVGSDGLVNDEASH